MLEIQGPIFATQKKNFKNIMISFYTSFEIRNCVNVWQISRRIREKLHPLSLLFSFFPSRFIGMSCLLMDAPAQQRSDGWGEKKFFSPAFSSQKKKRKEREKNTSSFPFPFILLYTHLVMCGLSAFFRKRWCVHLF